MFYLLSFDNISINLLVLKVKWILDVTRLNLNKAVIAKNFWWPPIQVYPYDEIVAYFQQQGIGDPVPSINFDNPTSFVLVDNGIETKYLTADNIPALFKFGKDEMPKEGDIVEVNQLTKPVMIQYYNDAVRNWE